MDFNVVWNTPFGIHLDGSSRVFFHWPAILLRVINWHLFHPCGAVNPMLRKPNADVSFRMPRHHRRRSPPIGHPRSEVG